MTMWNSEGQTITSPRWVMPIQRRITEANVNARTAAASRAVAEKAATEHCVVVKPLAAAPYSDRRPARRGYAVPSRARFANRVLETEQPVEKDQNSVRRKSIGAAICVCRCPIH